jgi:hypothetical protein
LRAIADPMMPAPITATVAPASLPFAPAMTTPSFCGQPRRRREPGPSFPAWRRSLRSALPLAGIRQVPLAGVTERTCAD